MVQVPEPLEARHELFVKDRHLPSEDQARGLERGDCGHDVREPAGMVPGIPADEPDAALVLEGYHPPAVVLLLVHSAFRVEGTGDFGSVHEGGEH